MVAVTKIRKIVARLLALAALVVAATMLVPPLLGYERYVIAGGSMSGTYELGSIVFERPVPVDDLRKGDVITYAPPAGKAADELVTHRIASITRDRHGELSFRTKGDANPTVDPWRFSLDAPEQARAEFAVPYVGYALIALSDRVVRILAIGLPALLIALFMAARLWREAGIEAARRREVQA